MLGRQGDRKGRLYAGDGIDAHAPAVKAHDVLDDGKAQARSTQGAAPRLVDAIEALEESRQVLRGDANAKIHDT